MKREKNDITKNQTFHGIIDAKRCFHSVVGDDEQITSDVIARLWKERQAKVAYVQSLKVDYYFYRRMRPYFDSYMAELDRLILDAVGSLATREPVLSLKGWCEK